MSDLSGARIVVTGGAGFIGSHLVDALLAAGAESVVVVDTFFLGREENLEAARAQHGDALTVYREDAGDLGAMTAICRAERPDLAFNLATKALLYSFFNPVGAFTVNVAIATALAELLRTGLLPRLVHVSSSEVYGTAQQISMSEAHPLLAETSYAAGKAAADLLLMSYVNMYDLDVVTVRPFNNYGPRQNDDAFAAIVPLTIKRLLDGSPPVIEGDGLQTRDFIYVQDAVAAILRLATLDAALGQTLNVGSGRETAIREIVDTLCEIAGYTGEIVQAPARTADVRRHRADVSRVETLLGGVAPTDLRDGLEWTYSWHAAAVGS
ncbi:MAG: GDP-mannose 4,6-dehydratase [Solirubrobacteraceae bacterium]|nr:GDP-mannose 4,6-dehydratase [Solirubrobacteraceae bacterium]